MIIRTFFQTDLFRRRDASSARREKMCSSVRRDVIKAATSVKAKTGLDWRVARTLTETEMKAIVVMMLYL